MCSSLEFIDNIAMVFKNPISCSPAGYELRQHLYFTIFSMALKIAFLG